MASRGLNKVMIIGRLGQDPDARAMPSGNAVSNFSIATSETWKDKQTGDMNERTEWHNIVAFNRLAEICNQYLTKGSLVYVEGSLRTRKWQDNNGNDRYTTEIVASEMQMLDSRGGDDVNRNTGRAAAKAAMQDERPARQQPTVDDFDDDIPF